MPPLFRLVSNVPAIRGAAVAAAARAPSTYCSARRQNWNVKLMPLRICGVDGCPAWSEAKAFAYAGQMGASVANASLSGTGPSTTVSDAILNSPNTLFVVAAGNESSDNDASPRYPCQYPRDNIVCVASSTMTDTRSSFSDWGLTSVDLAAPGSNVVSDGLPMSFFDQFNANANNWVFSVTTTHGVGSRSAGVAEPLRQSGRQLP